MRRRAEESKLRIAHFVLPPHLVARQISLLFGCLGGPESDDECSGRGNPIFPSYLDLDLAGAICE